MTHAADIARAYGLHAAGRGAYRGRCPVCGYGNDAFSLTVKGSRTLAWCASCQDQRAVAEALRRVSGDGYAPPIPPRAIKPEAATKAARAIALWNRSTGLRGSAGAIYLAEVRGLPGLARSGALRFLGDCPHPSGTKLPALVALVVDQAGKPIGLHRTFLQPDGRGKAKASPPKATLGPIWGGAIRLDPVATVLVIGEGIETAASAGLLLRLPGWAAISAGNLARGLILPPDVRSVVIAADHDVPGLQAAEAAAARWVAEGRRVRIARPDHAGDDFNDVLKGRGNG
jgi:putative DNA primase/helicase